MFGVFCWFRTFSNYELQQHIYLLPVYLLTARACLSVSLSLTSFLGLAAVRGLVASWPKQQMLMFPYITGAVVPVVLLRPGPRRLGSLV